MKSKFFYLVIMVVSLTALLFSGCAEAFQTPSAPTSSSQSALTGRLQILVTDAPPEEDIDAIWVTVDSVEVHVVTANTTATASSTIASNSNAEQEQEQERENGNSKNKNNNKNQNQSQQQAQTLATSSTGADNSGWQTISLSEQADMSAAMDGINLQLLELQGKQLPLASGNFTAGKYTQIRMDVSKVEIAFKDGSTKEAKLPSGKLKFVQPFEIIAGQDTSIIFDFDALKSVNVTGNGDIIFKPVIKLSVTTLQETEASTEEMEITTASLLPNGVVGTAYSQTLQVTGGEGPYTWELINGTILPAGLELGSDGLISGTPTTEGPVTFAVQVTDSASPPNTTTAGFTITVDPQ